MPNLDGTGPRGEGPRTGLGRGNCSDNENSPVERSSFVTRMFRNRRNGAGLGRGRNRGFRFWRR